MTSAWPSIWKKKWSELLGGVTPWRAPVLALAGGGKEEASQAVSSLGQPFSLTVAHSISVLTSS